MPESDIVPCFLCGKKASSLKMNIIGYPVLGHHLDCGMAVKWVCPDPCFKTYRNSPGIKQRVRQWQDRAEKWAKASILSISDAELEKMETLPEGLKITPADRARWVVLRDNLNDVRCIQSLEDNQLVHKLCRNANKNPFYNDKTGTLKDYTTLVEDFSKLEKLSPKEKERFNA